MDDRQLALSMSGLDWETTAPWGGSARSVIEWTSRSFRWISLDATRPGIRSRELDRSARRDLAGFLRRNELSLAGLEAFVPPHHFTDSARADRAVAAVAGACELLAEVGGLCAANRVVNLEFPKDLADDIRESLASLADRLGVTIADYAVRPKETALAGLGVGVDPAAVILKDGEPTSFVAQAGDRLASARLSDADSVSRCPLDSAQGRLDLLSYRVSLGVSSLEGPVVLDVRGLGSIERTARAIEAGRAAWEALG